MPKIFGASLISASSWILILILVVCNGFLVRQNWQLIADVEKLSLEQRVQVGDNFGDLSAVDLENKPVTINSQAGIKKVILVSNTSCPYCKKQNTYWLECLKQLDPAKYEAIALFNEREERQAVDDYLAKMVIWKAICR